MNHKWGIFFLHNLTVLSCAFCRRSSFCNRMPKRGRSHQPTQHQPQPPVTRCHQPAPRCRCRNWKSCERSSAMWQPAPMLLWLDWMTLLFLLAEWICRLNLLHFTDATKQVTSHFFLQPAEVTRKMLRDKHNKKNPTQPNPVFPNWVYDRPALLGDFIPSPNPPGDPTVSIGELISFLRL